MTKKKPWCFGKMLIPMRTTSCSNCKKEIYEECKRKSYKRGVSQ